MNEITVAPNPLEVEVIPVSLGAGDRAALPAGRRRMWTLSGAVRKHDRIS